MSTLFKFENFWEEVPKLLTLFEAGLMWWVSIVPPTAENNTSSSSRSLTNLGIFTCFVADDTTCIPPDLSSTKLLGRSILIWVSTEPRVTIEFDKVVECIVALNTVG